jgi:hypothetical protein
MYCTRTCQIQRDLSALILAAQLGYTECVRLLVHGGADKEATNTVRSLTNLVYSSDGGGRFVAFCLARAVMFFLF